MNQSFVAPVPFNEDATEWIDMHHFSIPGPFVAAVKHRYNSRAHRYEWVETGPFLFYPDYPASEASVVRLKDSWGVCARPMKTGLPVLWMRTENPFADGPKKVYAQKSASHLLGGRPVTAYRCADGVIRVMGVTRRPPPTKTHTGIHFTVGISIPTKNSRSRTGERSLTCSRRGYPFGRKPIPLLIWQSCCRMLEGAHSLLCIECAQGQLTIPFPQHARHGYSRGKECTWNLLCSRGI